MASLQQQASELYVEDRVTFYGYCPREKLVKLYNRSDIFVLPSMAESFGMVFVEAMSCGLPVIGARVGGVPDIIHAENGMLVEPDSVDDVIEAVSKLAEDEGLRKSMSAENRKKAVEQYAWSSVADAYEQIYRTVTETEQVSADVIS